MPVSLRSLIGRTTTSLPVTARRGAMNVGSMGRMGGTFYSINPSFFQQMRELARDFRDDAGKVNYAIDRAMGGYAAVCLGFAQKRSRGFLDPSEQNPQWAWKIPVRRITGRYLTGWKVMHTGIGRWRTFNDAREAYFIEFGINHQGTGVTGPQGTRVRIRRPILKLSIIDTMAFASETQLDWHEFMGAFTLSSYHSPITGMTEEAARATVASGEGFVVGATTRPM